MSYQYHLSYSYYIHYNIFIMIIGHIYNIFIIIIILLLLFIYFIIYYILIYLFCLITVTTETDSKFCTPFPATAKSYQYHLLYIYLLYSYYIGPTLQYIYFYTIIGYIYNNNVLEFGFTASS